MSLLKGEDMLKKAINAHLVKVDDKYIITDSKIVFEVNELGARIFDLCNGKNTIEDIASKLSKKYVVDYTTIFNDCSEYIDELRNLELVT